MPAITLDNPRAARNLFGWLTKKLDLEVAETVDEAEAFQAFRDGVVVDKLRIVGLLGPDSAESAGSVH